MFGTVRRLFCVLTRTNSKHSEKLQVTRDLIDHTDWTRSNTKNSRASSGNLCPTSIVDDLGTETEAESLSLQHHHVVLARAFQGHLHLAVPFPAFEDRRVWSSPEKSLVAGESSMAALSRNFAYNA